jgi:hypothetical protein
MTDDPRCSTAQSQVASMHQLLQWAGATTIKSIYLVILNSPNRWGTVNENRNFIRELIQTLEVGNQNDAHRRRHCGIPTIQFRSVCQTLFHSAAGQTRQFIKPQPRSKGRAMEESMSTIDFHKYEQSL